MALVATLSGCLYDFTGPKSNGNGYDGGTYACTYYCTDLDITPTGQNLLVGDTMKLYAYTNRVPDPSVEWTAATDNFVLMNGSSSSKTLTLPEYTGPVVKATATGAAKLTSKLLGTTYTADYNFQIADSSSMTSLRIYTYNPTVKVGQSVFLNSTLKDANGIQYKASPGWTSLDESIGKVSGYSFGGEASVNTMKTGTVRIVASFRALRDTLVITVIP
jgi:hypothetical protein